MKVHHIGYAVKNIEIAHDDFCKLGYIDVGTLTHDNTRNIDILFMRNGETMIELVAPLVKENPSPVDKQLLKNGASPYHICYECESIEKTISTLKENKWIIVDKPSEAPAIDNNKVAFLYKSRVGLIELVEKGI